MSALIEIASNSTLSELLVGNEYARNATFENSDFIRQAKSNKSLMGWLITKPSIIDDIRNDPELRASFNKNRIRLLMPGDVSWTVPDDFPADFVHIQLVGGGGKGTKSTGSCGGYVQFVVDVKPGDVLTGNIGAPGKANANAGPVTFAGVTAEAGVGASQSGAFLVKASGGGFEGGIGGNGRSQTATSTGDGTLGSCAGTGGIGQNAGTDGGGGGATGASNVTGYAGGGGYGGGGGGAVISGNVATSNVGSGGSGAIVITMPDGYIPEFVCFNHEGWIRDENIFNDFGNS